MRLFQVMFSVSSEKAFDRIEWPYLIFYQNLNLFLCIKWFRALYQEPIDSEATAFFLTFTIYIRGAQYPLKYLS